MSIKSKVIAAAAALTLVGGFGAASAVSANAATPSCGKTCINIFNKNFSTFKNPSFVLDVLRQGEKVGQPVILFRQANSDPAEDWTYSDQGLVSDFYAAQLVSASLDLHYGGLGCEKTVAGVCTKHYPDDWALEIEYSPYGVESGLCMGVPTTAAQDTFVSLQPCGVSSKTVWVVDQANSTGHTLYNYFVPLINGSDTNFSNPYVLTYPQNSYPTDMPRPQLTTQTLQLNSNHNIVNTSQEYGARLGVLP